MQSKLLTPSNNDQRSTQTHVLIFDVGDEVMSELEQFAREQNITAAHAGTIMGVESNGMQFFPEASKPEAKIHPGIYTRKEGTLDVSTLGKTGFGYRVDEMQRDLEEFRQ